MKSLEFFRHYALDNCLFFYLFINITGNRSEVYVVADFDFLKLRQLQREEFIKFKVRQNVKQFTWNSK